ncbi:hypothetical protein Dsin_002068, partial [Dipteronia sinensis]
TSLFDKNKKRKNLSNDHRRQRGETAANGKEYGARGGDDIGEGTPSIRVRRSPVGAVEFDFKLCATAKQKMFVECSSQA